LRVFPESGHVLPLDRDGSGVCSAVVSFFREA
jgi:esterase/lipase